MQNPYLCLTIVCFIGGGGLLAGLGIIVLAAMGRDIPQALAMLVAAAFGSLSSFLVSPPRGSLGTGHPQALPGKVNVQATSTTTSDTTTTSEQHPPR